MKPLGSDKTKDFKMTIELTQDDSQIVGYIGVLRGVIDGKMDTAILTKEDAIYNDGEVFADPDEIGAIIELNGGLIDGTVCYVIPVYDKYHDNYKFAEGSS